MHTAASTGCPIGPVGLPYLLVVLGSPMLPKPDKDVIRDPISRSTLLADISEHLAEALCCPTPPGIIYFLLLTLAKFEVTLQNAKNIIHI